MSRIYICDFCGKQTEQIFMTGSRERENDNFPENWKADETSDQNRIYEFCSTGCFNRSREDRSRRVISK